MIQNEVKLKMEQKDVWPMLCSAFRYALGRRTYMPSLVSGVILANRTELTKFQREQLAREVYEFEETYGDLGDECDAVVWHRFATEIVKGGLE